VSCPEELHHKLLVLSKAISGWSKHRVGNIRVQINAARQFIEWCDQRQEHRSLIQLEKLTLSIVKKRYTYLSALEVELWKQRASVKWRLKIMMRYILINSLREELFIVIFAN
jgi:hypothetical protein